MAEKRKLLAEIEKCFKKTDEGVELFEDIMSKMQDAHSDNQREKYQDDLKKEIKKLQRLRDQVKGWQSSSEVKEKDKLNYYRRLVEQKMEQFKDVERENKTKPHSKLGLCAEEKLVPKEKEKADTIEWLQNQIRELGVESDRTEMKIESINTADSGKRRGKKDDGKKGDKEKNLEKLTDHLDQMTFHIDKLEVCMRMVNNESLEASLVMDVLKDPMEMYIDALDPDYDGNEGELESLDPTDYYDELDLGQLSAQLGTVNIGPTEEEKVDTGKQTTDKPDDVSSSSLQVTAAVPRAAAASPVPKRVVAAVVAPVTPITPTMKSTKVSSPDQVTVTLPVSMPAVPSPGIPYNSIAAKKVAAVATVPSQVLTPTGKASFTVPAVTRHPSSQPKAADPPIISCPPPPVRLIKITEDENKKTVNDATETIAIDSNANIVDVPNTSNTFDKVIGGPPKPHIAATAAKQQLDRDAEMAKTMEYFRQWQETNRQNVNTQPQTAYIPAWLGASPLGQVSMTPELDLHLSILEGATQFATPDDSEKPRTYLPKIKYPVSPHYHQDIPRNADTLDNYLKFTPELLFFVFYYMEGTRAQLLAAKALKKYSWRFHTKYLTWFQRHEEPKQITDEFEQGTYVYFDFEKWSQRKKEAFTFEYRYLEDKDF